VRISMSMLAKNRKKEVTGVDQGEKTRVVLRRNSRQQKKKEYFF